MSYYHTPNPSEQTQRQDQNVSRFLGRHPDAPPLHNVQRISRKPPGTPPFETPSHSAPPANRESWWKMQEEWSASQPRPMVDITTPPPIPDPIPPMRITPDLDADLARAFPAIPVYPRNYQPSRNYGMPVGIPASFAPHNPTPMRPLPFPPGPVPLFSAQSPIMDRQDTPIPDVSGAPPPGNDTPAPSPEPSHHSSHSHHTEHSEPHTPPVSPHGGGAPPPGDGGDDDPEGGGGGGGGGAPRRSRTPTPMPPPGPMDYGPLIFSVLREQREILRQLAYDRAHPPQPPAVYVQAPAAPAHTPSPRDDRLGRDPDTFDGSQPKKLRSFITQCELVFRARSSNFRGPHSDARKISYALTYLRGAAQTWFEPYLLEADEENPPIFFVVWRSFLGELLAHFGPVNAVQDAERELDELTMPEHQHIEKYDVTFISLSVITQYTDAPLRHIYYKGLPDRIKDALIYLPPADTLQSLRSAAQIVDRRYWERHDEKRAHTKRSTPAKSGSSSTDTPKNSDRQNDNSGRSSNSNSNSNSSSGNTRDTSGRSRDNSRNNSSNNNNSGSSSSASSGNSRSSSDPKPYAKHLGKDGKLKPEVREHRIKNNLCMICGDKNHFADKCPKKATKARAAKTTPAKTDATPAPSEASSAPPAPTAQAKN